MYRIEGYKVETGNEIRQKREMPREDDHTNLNSAIEYCGGGEIDK
jgi:hypothetical protein